VPFTSAQLAALGITDPTKLNVVYWNGTAWATLLPAAGCSVDTAAQAVVVVTNVSAEFALSGPASLNVYLPMIVR
jgi:hypothetical protein